MLFSPQARSLLKITVCSEKRKIARADCKTRRRRKHYELEVIASPLWWLCPCLWEVIPQTFLCWWVGVPSLGRWPLLFWNFLSSGGGTLGSERKCIKRRDGRVRGLNHSAKVSFDCELWHQHWIRCCPSCKCMSLNPSKKKCIKLGLSPPSSNYSCKTSEMAQESYTSIVIFKLCSKKKKKRKMVGRCWTWMWRVKLKLDIGTVLAVTVGISLYFFEQQDSTLL